MHQHKSISTTNNLCLKYILTLVNIYYIVFIYILNVGTRNQKVYFHFLQPDPCVLKRSSFFSVSSVPLPRFLLPFCKHYLQTLKIHKTWFYKPIDYIMYIQARSLCNVTRGSSEESLTLKKKKKIKIMSVHKPTSQITFRVRPSRWSLLVDTKKAWLMNSMVGVCALVQIVLLLLLLMRCRRQCHW